MNKSALGIYTTDMTYYLHVKAQSEDKSEIVDTNVTAEETRQLTPAVMQEWKNQFLGKLSADKGKTFSEVVITFIMPMP